MRSGPILRALELKQKALALQAAGVTGEPALLADHAVTGNDDREWIAADGVADLPSLHGVAQLPRHLAVGRGPGVRDAIDQLPHMPLKLIPDDAGLQREFGSLAGKILSQLPFRGLEAAL